MAISTIAVLAGGLAVRMRPLTEKVPKVLLDVEGEPFVSHQLRLFKREGIKRVVLCLGYLGEQVVDFVGDGSRFGLDVAYSFDGDRLIGTGGALRRALPLLGETFFVIYGDSYLDISYQPVAEYFSRVKKEALMTVFRNEGRWDTSNVTFENGDILVYSKTKGTSGMQYIDYGLSIVRDSTLMAYNEHQIFDFGSILESLAARGQIAGYEVFNRFYEIGSPAGWAETKAYLASSRGSERN